MKRVSFEVAKYLKEAGYPQERPLSFYISKEYKDFSIGESHDATVCYVPIEYRINAPTYIDVWLWLWREKHINSTPEYDQISGLFISCGVSERDDPEDAIIAAIEYLVTNKLI